MIASTDLDCYMWGALADRVQVLAPATNHAELVAARAVRDMCCGLTAKIALRKRVLEPLGGLDYVLERRQNHLHLL
jgi:hypothetical protein